MNGCRAPEALDLALLQHPQQLDLDLYRKVANFVDEDRRAVGHSKRPICRASAP
jgi:hypothetical protein